MISAKAIAHLRRDPAFRKLLKGAKPPGVKRSGDLYLALLRAIVGQQLSVKAAATIWNRFLSLFSDGYPAPQALTGMETPILRSAGLSGQKAGYLRNIAQFALDHTLDERRLGALSDEDLIVYLTQIKGVGRWTAEMILMFSLGRPDVLPKDDLGIQQGIARLYGIRFRDKKHMYRRMEELAEGWRPYRSVACFYLWHSKDNVPVKVKKPTAVPMTEKKAKAVAVKRSKKPASKK